jgi:hypothetical protein
MTRDEFIEEVVDLAVKMQACIDKEAHSAEHVREATLTLFVRSSLLCEMTDEEILRDVRKSIESGREQRDKKK